MSRILNWCAQKFGPCTHGNLKLILLVLLVSYSKQLVPPHYFFYRLEWSNSETDNQGKNYIHISVVGFNALLSTIYKIYFQDGRVWHGRLTQPAALLHGPVAREPDDRGRRLHEAPELPSSPAAAASAAAAAQRGPQPALLCLPISRRHKHLQRGHGGHQLAGGRLLLRACVRCSGRLPEHVGRVPAARPAARTRPTRRSLLVLTLRPHIQVSRSCCPEKSTDRCLQFEKRKRLNVEFILVFAHIDWQ